MTEVFAVRMPPSVAKEERALDISEELEAVGDGLRLLSIDGSAGLLIRVHC